MIYHIVVGDMAAQPLQEAIFSESSMQGEIVVLKDILHVGPLQKEEDKSFSETRSAFWNQLVLNEKQPIEVKDTETIQEVSLAMHNNPEAKAWFWMAPSPADVTAYHWVLKYLSRYSGRLFILSIAGLPFLDENGKVYYPKNISEILPKELVKARRLARLVTPAEVEIDTDEWQKMQEQNAPIRTHEGGKKITARNADHYDNQLLSFCSHQYQKALRIVSQAMNKFNIPTGDLYLGYRLRKMAEEGKLQIQGDVTKALKDFDVKLPGGNEQPAETPAEAQADNA